MNTSNAKMDIELMLVTGPLTVIALQMIVSLLTRKIPAFRAITIGTSDFGAGMGDFDSASERYRW